MDAARPVSPPPPPANKRDLLVDTMNEIAIRYPTDDEWNRLFATRKSTLNLADNVCKFYISNKDKRGTAFSAAYNDAKQLKDNNKQLCASVGSMLCDVFPDLKSSMESALNEIGVRPLFVSLPCDELEAEAVRLMDFPTMLVYFGCCFLHVLEKSDEILHEIQVSRCISELREKAGCDPDAHVRVPFDFKKAAAIKTMLGASSTLVANMLRCVLNSMKSGDARIGGVCQSLCTMVNWSGMHALHLVDNALIKPQSPVLLDYRINQEVIHLVEAASTVASHFCPQFYMYLASNVDRLKLDSARFPTVMAVARELDRVNKNGGSTSADDSEEVLSSEADPKTVKSLVKLHQLTRPQQKTTVPQEKIAVPQVRITPQEKIAVPQERIATSQESTKKESKKRKKGVNKKHLNFT